MTPKTDIKNRYWNIATTDGGEKATITLEGEIIDYPKAWLPDELKEGHYYTSDDFREDLAKCAQAKEITVYLNSPGGNLYVGIAIHNALKALPGKVTTVITGFANSAASIIFCAGDERKVYDGSILMVHGVAVGLNIIGNYNDVGLTDLIGDLRKEREAIKVMNEAVASIYAATTGGSKEEYLSAITGGSELWMTAEDALARGFATGYSDDAKAEPLRLVACSGKTSLYSGSRLLSQDFHAPKNATELGFIPSDTAPTAEQESPNPNNKMDNENTPTTEPVEETPAPAPVDTAAIAAQARADERARIASITAQAEKLGSRVDKSLVNLAINGDTEHEPMTPEAFALAAINALAPERKEAASFLATREQELAASNNVATAAPPAVDAAPKNHGLEVIDRLEKEEAAQRK